MIKTLVAGKPQETLLPKHRQMSCSCLISGKNIETSLRFQPEALNGYLQTFLGTIAKRRLNE